MPFSARQALACLTALLLGVGSALLVTSAEGVRTANAATAKQKAGTKKHKAKKRKAKKRSTAKLTAKRGRGKAFVPKAMLGPRWAQIGGGTNTTATTTTTTKVVYTVPRTTTTATTPGLALGVGLYDSASPPWRIQPSVGVIPKGRYIVQMQNFGEDPHDLIIYNNGSASVLASFPRTDPSGQRGVPSLVTQEVDFASSGSYRLFCSIDDHAARGMDATLTVAN